MTKPDFCQNCTPDNCRCRDLMSGFIKFLGLILAPVIIILALKFIGPLPVSVSQTTIQKGEPFMVSGEGSATTTPDRAEITFGITVNKPTVKVAQTEANTIINNITQAMKDLGVGESDIKTQNYSVYPNYDYNANPQKIIGYNISTNLLVKFTDFDVLNRAIDQATSLGANQVGGINFTLSDEKRLEAENQARGEAVRIAKDKAEGLANASGIKLGKLVNVTESSTPNYPVPMYAKADAIGLGGGVERTEVQPGSQEVKLTVTLSYETL